MQNEFLKISTDSDSPSEAEPSCPFSSKSVKKCRLGARIIVASSLPSLLATRFTQQGMGRERAKEDSGEGQKTLGHRGANNCTYTYAYTYTCSYTYTYIYVHYTTGLTI